MVNNNSNWWPKVLNAAIWTFIISVVIDITIGGLAEDAFLKGLAGSLTLSSIEPTNIVKVFQIFFTVCDYIAIFDGVFLVVAWVVRLIKRSRP